MPPNCNDQYNNNNDKVTTRSYLPPPPPSKEEVTTTTATTEGPSSASLSSSSSATSTLSSNMPSSSYASSSNNNSNNTEPSSSSPNTNTNTNTNTFIISLRTQTKNPKIIQNKLGVPSSGGGIININENEASYITKLHPTSSDDGESSIIINENPYTYNLQDNIGKDQFINILKQQVVDTNRSVLVLITGFNNHAPKVITRYRAVQMGLNKAASASASSSSEIVAGEKKDNSSSSQQQSQQSQEQSQQPIVICFDWPARKNVLYIDDRDTARKSSKMLFTTCLNILQNHVGLSYHKIHIMTFSMGSFLLYKALSEKPSTISTISTTTSSSASQKKKQPIVGHVLMVQSDTARRNFNLRGKHNKSKLSNILSYIGLDLTVYYSSHDIPLQLSSYMRFRYRLGYYGIPKQTLLKHQPTITTKTTDVEKMDNNAADGFDNDSDEEDDGDDDGNKDKDNKNLNNNNVTATYNNNNDDDVIPIHNVSCTEHYKSVYVSPSSSSSAAAESITSSEFFWTTTNSAAATTTNDQQQQRRRSSTVDQIQNPFQQNQNQRQRRRNTITIGDTHEWAFFGGNIINGVTNTITTNSNSGGGNDDNNTDGNNNDHNDDDKGLLYSGDLVFITDVYQVINGSKTYQYREQRQRQQSNDSATNNNNSNNNDWKLKANTIGDL